MKQKKSLKFKIFAGIAISLIILVSAFFIYVSVYYKADSYAKENLKSDALVKVEKQGDILFKPLANDKKVGFIFYPGAKVEASAYAPLAKEIAAKGYTVIIAKMSFNLAILSPNKAENITSKYKKINTWAIGGHSLGGVMAASYAYKNSEIKGLVFLASYAENKNNFSDKPIKVLSLWGSKDKVADLNKVKAGKAIMPSNSEFIEIEGGNHGGFGDYGHQKGDGQATISNKQQMSAAAKYIIKFLEDLK